MASCFTIGFIAISGVWRCVDVEMRTLADFSSNARRAGFEDVEVDIVCDLKYVNFGGAQYLSEWVYQ